MKKKRCRHRRVVQAPSYSGIFVEFLPTRLCLDCGIDEEAWHWPGRLGNDGLGKKTRLNRESVVHVDRDDLDLLRP